MVAACDMGMSPVMRGEGERRKSLWPKLSGGSGNGRGVESGDKGEADGMTTDRSSLSMRSVFMYELRGETSRGECKEVSIYLLSTRSFTDGSGIWNFPDKKLFSRFKRACMQYMYMYDRSGQIPRSDSGVTCAAQLSKLQKPRGPAAPVAAAKLDHRTLAHGKSPWENG